MHWHPVRSPLRRCWYYFLLIIRCHYTHSHNKRRAATQTSYQEIPQLHSTSAYASRPLNTWFIEQSRWWIGGRCKGGILGWSGIVSTVIKKNNDDMWSWGKASGGIWTGTNKDRCVIIAESYIWSSYLGFDTEDDHGKLRGQIEQLKTALEHAQMIRRQKIEYDAVTEKVNTLPSREELEQ